MTDLGSSTAEPDSDAERKRPAEANQLVVVAALCLIAAGLTFAATVHGAGLSPDSVAYISSARNLATGNGLSASWGGTLTLAPPGFPAVLAGGDVLGVDAWTVARAVNVVAAAAVVLLSFLLLRRHARSSVAVLFGTAVVAISPALLSTFRMAWSEPLFLAVAVAFLILLEHLVGRATAPSWAILALPACLVWAGFLLRYAGLTLLVTGFVVLALSVQTWGVWGAFASAVRFGILGTLVPVAWMMRNVAVGGGPLGPRASAARGLGTNTKQAVKTVSAWIAPGRIPVAVSGSILAFAAIMAVAGVRRGLKRRVISAAHVRAVVPVLAFLVIYAGYVIVSASITGIDPLNDRLLSPLVIPLVVVVVWTIDSVGATVSLPQRRTAAIAVGIVAGLWILYPIQRALRDTQSAAVHGIGYATRANRNSELAKTIADVALPELVYSNEPDEIYVDSRREPIYLSPREHAYASNDTVNDAAEFVRTVACRDDVVLAWLTRRNTRSGLVGLGRLRQLVHLEQIRAVSDGVLYRVSPLLRRTSANTATDTNCKSLPEPHPL